jgi:lysyl-tRNA synthetase class 2
MKENKNPYPYPHKFNVSHNLSAFIEEFGKKEIENGQMLKLEKPVSVAGRVHNIR